MGRAFVYIWHDNWLPRPHGMKPVDSVRHCRLRWVSHFIDSHSKLWDEMLVRRYFYACDIEEILKIKISRNSCMDHCHTQFQERNRMHKRLMCAPETVAHISKQISNSIITMFITSRNNNHHIVLYNKGKSSPSSVCLPPSRCPAGQTRSEMACV